MTQLSPIALEMVARAVFSARGWPDAVHPAFEHEQEDWEACATAAITAYLAQMEKEGWVMVPKEATGKAKSAIGAFVKSRAIPSPSDGDPDDVYFDSGHARELYAVVLAAAQNWGE